MKAGIWNLFLTSVKKDYSEELDYKKLSVFVIVATVVFVNVHTLIFKQGINSDLVNLDIWTLGLLITGGVATKMTKPGAELHAKEMEANSTKTTEA